MDKKYKEVKILIASPSDVEKERDIAEKVIGNWNIVNSDERKLTIEPVLWESHSAAESGDRTQGIINKQIVDTCDVAIGIFWTRIGTHTGIVPGGAVEEIERLEKNNKKVMLYFSGISMPRHGIDYGQLQKVDDFKAARQDKGDLIWEYNDLNEFERLLTHHLDIQVRRWFCEIADSDDFQTEVPDIFISYAREDYERVKKIVVVLEKQGWSVFWDRQILPGQTWDDYIEERIIDAKCVLVLWSFSSIDRKSYVREEAALARERDSLVPALLDDVQPPFGFRRIHAFDLSSFSYDKSHDDLSQLFEAIRDRAGEPKKKNGQALFSSFPSSFHNPYEHDAQYILVPGGRYIYSVTKQEVSVPDLYIAKYPVTNRQYRSFIDFLSGNPFEFDKKLSLSHYEQVLRDFAQNGGNSVKGLSDYCMRNVILSSGSGRDTMVTGSSTKMTSRLSG